MLSRAKKIVIIHDVIAELYLHLTLPSRTARLFWKAKVCLRPAASGRGCYRFGIFPAEGISKHFDIDPACIRVIEEASDPVFRVLDETVTFDPALSSLGFSPDQRLVVYIGGFQSAQKPGKISPSLRQNHRT
ncbi:MAG: hypothetical protein WKF84_22815 [Pyrinomonadaceae bacterium]